MFSATQVIRSEGTEGAKFRLSGKGVDQDPKGIFRINEISGDVSVTRPLDREAIANYEVSAHRNWISASVLVIYTFECVCIRFWKDCSCWRLNYEPLSSKISRRTSYPLEIVNVCIFTRNWNSALLSACHFCHLSLVEVLSENRVCIWFVNTKLCSDKKRYLG